MQRRGQDWYCGAGGPEPEPWLLIRSGVTTRARSCPAIGGSASISSRALPGSTEAGNVASLEHADIRRKPGSCGVPSPSSEVRVDDDGELCVRGPLLFDGYFGDPQATAAALTDGWYRTGDMAETDAHGYLSIVGRAGDLIRSGGESVAPSELADPKAAI